MADLDTDVACTNAYSDIEEDFFRVGDAISAGERQVVEPEAEPARTKSLWARLFERPVRVPSEADFVPAPAARTRPPTERPVAEPADEDEWDWVIAAARARARHATQPG